MSTNIPPEYKGDLNDAFEKMLRGTGIPENRMDIDLYDGLTNTGSGGTGWISITDVSVSGGTASNKVYADAPNNTILQSVSVSLNSLVISVKSSSPNVTVGGVTAVLPPHASGGYYLGTVAVTGSGAITAQLVTPNGDLGAIDTVQANLVPAPTILTLAFTGSYPGAQTELKAGDTFQVTGTTNVPAVGVQVSAFGAGIAQSISFASSTSFTVTITIADQGNTPQALIARMSAVDSNAAVGPTFDTTNTVILNNLHPTVTFTGTTYPATQSALKGTEVASVAVTTANLDSILFTSPNGDLSITAPTVIAPSKLATRIAGSYNVATTNFSAVATRNANGATTTTNGVIAIANVAPTITVTTPAARLRSGGNNGTTVQGHVITLTSDQQLASAPTLLEGAGGGTFLASWSGGPTVYTRTLNVHDNDVKGAYTFNGLVATGLAGLVQNTVGSGAAYTLGGFVQRSLTFSAFSQNATINTGVVTYNKLTATIFSATNQPALRNASQGNLSNIVNTYTVLTLGTPTTVLFWNDLVAASTNSSGTAQILLLEEVP